MSENLSSGSSDENLASKPVRQQPAAPRRPAKVVEQPKPDQPIKVMKPLELKKKKD